jgi:hypothetical protein
MGREERKERGLSPVFQGGGRKEEISLSVLAVGGFNDTHHLQTRAGAQMSSVSGVLFRRCAETSRWLTSKRK